MRKPMSVARATEFANAWNEENAAKVAAYFTEDGVYYASVGEEHLGKAYKGRDKVERGVQRFFDKFKGGRFENTKVQVFGQYGTFEWDFVTLTENGKREVVAGCDILEFEGGMVKVKNAFRKMKG